MKRFLSLAVEYTLAARAHELKEYLVGVEVFDRDVSFDPRLDPIVRVEARRLRTKLVAYYEGPGLEDELIIEFVKGAYVPQFRSRSVLAAPEPHPDSIAVLPFRDLGPEPNHEYFSDGLSEELIHVLTRVPGLRVVAWHSAAQLKNDEHNLAYIRQQLGVETVLSGSVRRSGDQLRITAKLISTSDGRYLWTEVYDRRMHDLFAIEEDIARSIVNTLQIKLGRRPLARVAGQEMPKHTTCTCLAGTTRTAAPPMACGRVSSVLKRRFRSIKETPCPMRRFLKRTICWPIMRSCCPPKAFPWRGPPPGGRWN
jgi:serine/threonine-protein kinase